ncbi:zinc-dependent metalloprotease [Nocardioides dubius]|uniref:Zinc-dependent metalloprotease n=1 Tax=Nocardioides dubius TaxID=317019 RepID=A0ABP4EIS6_9ACTN
MVDKSGDEPENPFKGTPFEQFFGAGMPDLSTLMNQMQAMMTPQDGPVNWSMARDIARRGVPTPDPTPSASDEAATASALRLADLWLDDATEFPSGVTTTATWSRADWIEQTMPVWEELVGPVADQVVGALSRSIPEEARGMAGPLMGMLNQVGSALFGSQVGQALGALAEDVLTSTEIGLPLAPAGRAALVPTNVRAFAEGLQASYDDLLLYLALREAAHLRLFAHVPWLRDYVWSAVIDYARGMEFNFDGLQEQLGAINPMDTEAMQQAMDGGLLEPKRSPAQDAALRRLETVLALIEGWVDEVVGQAVSERMPSASAMQETIRRRRAAGGPAEQTFATLVGLELRPRRLRDASTLWGSLRSRQGIEARDGVWLHPDLLPTAADLDDPLGFREDHLAEVELSEDDFDVALRNLLDGSEGEGPTSSPDDPQDGPTP